MNFRKILSAFLVMAQLAVLSPAVLAAETEPDATTKLPLTYGPDRFSEAAGATISTETAKANGITINPTSNIWSFQKTNDQNSVYMPALRFSARTFQRANSSYIPQESKNLMTLRFSEDTISGKPVLDGNGYLFESELAVNIRDTNFIQLDLLGKDQFGNERTMTTLRFNKETVTTPYKNTGSISVYDVNGNKTGTARNFKRGLDSNDAYAAQILYLRIQLDFVNQTYSAWAAPSKTETGEHTQIVPSDDNLLIADAPLLAPIQEFTAISYTIDNYTYGNAIFMNHTTINSYEPEARQPEESQGKLRFGVISDIQYGRYGDAMGPKLRTALEQLKARAGENELDAIIFGGDMTNNGYADEYNAVISIIQEVFPPETSHTKMLFVRGNHDNYGNRQANYGVVTSAYPYNSSTTTVHDIKGYQFIVVGQDTSGNYADTVGVLHTQATINWLNASLIAAEQKDMTGEKPIFVAMHPHIKDTVYGSRIINGFRNNADTKSKYHWGTPDFQNILKGYKNVVTFSGHSHFPITDERSIYQDTFTSIGTGAIAYTEFEQEAWDESFHPQRISSFELENVGYYIEVDDETNQTTVNRLDFYRNKDIKEPWIIENALSESWLKYTDSRDTAAPVFDADTVPEISNIGPSSCHISFKQAADTGSDVHHYKIEMVNQTTGNVDAAFTPFSYYHMNSATPEYNWWDATGLVPETTYVARITAFDSFSNASDPITSIPFTTAGRSKMPTPIVDIGFTSAGAYDNSVFAKENGVTAPLATGKVPVVYNEKLNRYEGSFARTNTTSTGDEQSSASGNYFKVLLNPARRALMQTADGYTIETYFKPTEFNGTDNILGGAESGGFCLETDKDGKLNVFVRDSSNNWIKTSGGSYPGAETTLEKDAYSHLVVTNNGAVVNVYLNGELIDSAATTPGKMTFPTAAATDDDPYYGMILGGDYTPAKHTNGTYIDQAYAQNAFTGNIVFARIYDGALNADEVQAEYDAILGRAALTKADELKTAITETIPAKQNENNTRSVKQLLDEGLALIAKNDLTAEDVDTFLAKIDSVPETDVFSFPLEVNAGNISDYKLTAYGWTFDDTSVLWGNVKENNASTMWLPAYRFTMRAANDQTMAQLKFMEYTMNKPWAFDGDGYVFETEFSTLYKSNGYLALSLNGEDLDGNEQAFAQLRFVPSSDTTYKKSGRAYFTDANGAQTGNYRIVKMATDDEKSAGQLFYLKVKVDLINQRYSAWLLPRKTGAGAYDAQEPTDADLLVDNQPFNTDGVTAFTGMTYSITKSNSTNGVWVNSYSVDEYTPEALPETAAITVNKESLTAGGTATASVTITKAAAGEKAYSAYAVVLTGNTLQSVTPFPIVIADGKTTATTDISIKIPDDPEAVVKFFVWDANQTPICPASVNPIQ